MMGEVVNSTADKAVTAGASDTTSALFAKNGLKLGLFGLNCSSGGAFTTLPERYEISWESNRDLVQMADQAGFEAALPIARWRGFQGETNPWGTSFEPYCWAAGLAAVTSRITLFTTSHCLTVSPVMAAKQLATIDHISGGRAALNVVAGWFEQELRMFGAELLDHSQRYAYMSEWLDILLRLWTSDDEFDYEGALIDVRGAYQQPKPVQRPRPPLMSAAFSPRGLAVAARYADMVFVDSTDAASVARRVADVRGLAQTQGRHISAWIAVSIICADTDAEAERRLVHYRENGDEDAIRNFVNWTLGGTQAVGDSVTKIGASLASAGGAYSLHGSPRTIADGLAELAVAGLDGVVLTFPNYDAGLPVFISDVLPLLEKDGVRAPRNAA